MLVSLLLCLSFYILLLLDILAALRQPCLGCISYLALCFLIFTGQVFRSILFSETASLATGMADKVAEVTEAMKDVAVEAEDDSQVKKGEDGSVYTSDTRGSDEAGEGTYRVPYKTVIKVSLDNV